MSSTEIDKKALITRPFAAKIREIAAKAKELKESNPRLVIFVDDKYCSATDLARAILRDAKKSSLNEDDDKQ